MIETRGGRYGAEGLRGLQGRVEPVLVLPGYGGAEDGLSADGVRQDGRRGGVAGGLAGLTDRVLVSHEVGTEACSKDSYGGQHSIISPVLPDAEVLGWR